MVWTKALGDGRRVVRAQVPHDRFDLLPQAWHTPLNGGPHLVQVDREVAMDKDITHADESWPRNLWMIPSQRRREAGRCLADQREMVDHPGLKELVELEGGPPTNCVALDGGDCAKVARRIPSRRARSFLTEGSLPEGHGHAGGVGVRVP